MKIAALYDIHSNLPALEAVVGEVRTLGVDRILIGGDVLLGPMPRETLAYLRGLEIPAAFIRGNCEREVLNVMAGGEPTTVPEQFRSPIRWTAQQLDDDARRFVAGWPLTYEASTETGQVLFCHASPRDDNEFFTSATPADRVVPMLAGVAAPLVVCGHTHMQFERTIGSTRVVNAGSVGMPWGEPGAYWLLLGSGVELRRTNYDLADAAARIRETAYPQAEEFAAKNVLQPPSAADMLALLTKASLAPRAT
jgi:putative phosphoesterase